MMNSVFEIKILFFFKLPKRCVSNEYYTILVINAANLTLFLKIYTLTQILGLLITDNNKNWLPKITVSSYKFNRLNYNKFLILKLNFKY